MIWLGIGIGAYLAIGAVFAAAVIIDDVCRLGRTGRLREPPAHLALIVVAWLPLIGWNTLRWRRR